MRTANVTISVYVPRAVAEAIEAIAQREDRTKSKVAGRILAQQMQAAPEPSVTFATKSPNKTSS